MKKSDLETGARSRVTRMNLVLQDYQQLKTKYKDDFENIELTSASTSVSDGKRNDANYSSSS